ncbi:hypothetical protein PGT21_019791 [Puccinia graminis f. sp. tritici]|uniref:Uncharacterized protein n=1 Tax=Puccinia graminis f. sp. tritici TaxID=56615 RepID=A0A5B0LZ36_PUCGR|nr:hypothetical protein PGT21_019791 [Puccinia graminis f. sp. tritici]
MEAEVPDVCRTSQFRQCRLTNTIGMNHRSSDRRFLTLRTDCVRTPTDSVRLADGPRIREWSDTVCPTAAVADGLAVRTVNERTEIYCKKGPAAISHRHSSKPPKASFLREYQPMNRRR